jgi:hypothetical protein
MDAPDTAATALHALRTRVSELSQTLWPARDPHELMDTVAEAESLKTAVDALVLEVVAELEATDGVKPAGWASTADFMTTTAGGHHGCGKATVRLAQRVAEPVFAPIAEAMADGWLSSVKAQVVERAVDALPHNPDLRARAVAHLLGEAKRLDATDLKKAGRHLAAVVDPDGEERRAEKQLEREERAAHHSRHLSLTGDGAGGAWIKGRCTAEDAALIKSTLMPLAAPVPAGEPVCLPPTCREPGCRHDGRDPRDHGARMLDALVEACRRLQGAEVLPTDHGATPRITLLMHHDDLADGIGTALTETGEEISAGALRRLCCDADVIPAVLGSNSEVLDVGRTQRLVTAAIWKALVARDRHCRFPGCTRPPIMCHAHHVEHWLDGGATSLANLLLLCGHHHRLIHTGPWQITQRADGSYDFTPPPRLVRSATAGCRPPPRGS